MISNRGQAALEYLFTYGWAFMAILIMFGALMYFGVFDLSNLRGPVCSFSPGAVCDDFTISNDVNPGVPTLFFNLRNTFGVDLQITQVSASNADTGAALVCPIPGGGTWNIEAVLNFACTGISPYIEGQYYDYIVNVEFNQVGGSYSHNVTGTVASRTD